MNIDIKKILYTTGVDPEVLDSPEGRISYDAYDAIERESVDMSGDPYFGLHMGEFFEAGNWTILGYMLANCKTIGEAFQKSDRYSRVIGNLIHVKIQLKYKKVKAILATIPGAPELSRHCFETALSSTMRLAKNLSGKDLRPLEVGFAAPYPASTDEYIRIFGCPVLFEQKYCYMMLDWNFLNTPVLAPNESLLTYFEKYADEYLATADNVKGITHQVMKHILSQLDSRHLSEKSIAKTMLMSTRSLQANLKREGRKFSGLVREVREDLAKKYLKEDYSTNDITYLLGFSDPSVFRKSFKKWTGYTPKEYKDKMKGLG